MMTASPPPISSSKRSARPHSSLLIIVSTALITWIAATFFFSHKFHYRSTLWEHKHGLAIKGQGSFKSALKEMHQKKQDRELEAKVRHENHDHDNHTAVGMQGGAKSFAKKLKPYVNMTDYKGPSTVWKPYPYDFPCVPGESKHMLITPAHEGLLFQRPVKTGSTTLTNIILRLVDRQAKRLLPSTSSQEGTTGCKYRAMHATSRDLEFGKRRRDKSYLMSVVRDPTHKAVSRYFHFDVSVGQKVPTDEHFQLIMGRIYNQNSLAQDLTTRQVLGWATPDKLNAEQIVKDILDDYDFIAVTERMDESLVVWKILFHLDLSDILYIKARSSGSFSNGDSKRQCIYLVPSFLTPGMQDFFDSEKWKKSNAVDTLLYQAVYKSLDRTIDEGIGRDVFEEELDKFQVAQRLAAEFCANKVVGFCSPGGILNPVEKRTCVIWGEGCDYYCLKDFQQSGILVQ